MTTEGAERVAGSGDKPPRYCRPRIEDEGGIISGMVLAQARSAIVTPAIGDRRLVEAVHGVLVSGLEGDAGRARVIGRLPPLTKNSSQKK